MDPISVSALASTVVPLAGGTAGEAGDRAWTSLVTFLRTRFARDGSTEDAEMEALERQLTAMVHEPGAVGGERLATGLVGLAERDGDFDEWLRAWLRAAGPLAGRHASVVNVVGDHAQVHGGLVQAHTITGSVTFGAPPAAPRD